MVGHDELDRRGTVTHAELDLRNQEGTAAPTTGTHIRKEIVWNSEPSAAGYAGWVCVASGTPGTWKAFGLIES